MAMKTQVSTTGQQAMMSSKEIAHLTDKQPKDVIRDIWVMVESLYGIQKDGADLRHHKNQQVTLVTGVTACIDNRGYVSEFLLDRRHTEILITGYDVARRAAVIDRWFSLEAGAQQPLDAMRLLSDPVTLRGLLMNFSEDNQRLAGENQLLTATVDSLEKHFTKGMTIPAFCKHLNGVNINKMMWWAFQRKWIFNERRDPEKSPKWRVASYARHKYLTEDETKITPHGSGEMTKFVPVLLQGGCHRLYQLYMQGKLPMKKTWNGEFSHDKAIFNLEEK